MQQSNDKGTWYGWSVSRVGPIEDAAVYNIAKNFRNNLEKGLVKTRTPDKNPNPIHRTKDFHWEDLGAMTGDCVAPLKIYGRI